MRYYLTKIYLPMAGIFRETLEIKNDENPADKNKTINMKISSVPQPNRSNIIFPANNIKICVR